MKWISRNILIGQKLCWLWRRKRIAAIGIDHVIYLIQDPPSRSF